MMRSQLTRAAALILLLAAAACTDRPMAVGDPVPGELAVVLDAPEALGAVTFDLSGPALGDPVPADPDHLVFAGRLDGSGVRVAVVADRLNPTLASVPVPDIRDPSAYHVTLIEASNLRNEVRSPDGVALTLQVRSARDDGARAGDRR